MLLYSSVSANENVQIDFVANENITPKKTTLISSALNQKPYYVWGVFYDKDELEFLGFKATENSEYKNEVVLYNKTNHPKDFLRNVNWTGILFTLSGEFESNVVSSDFLCNEIYKREKFENKNLKCVLVFFEFWKETPISTLLSSVGGEIKKGESLGSFIFSKRTTKKDIEITKIILDAASQEDGDFYINGKLFKELVKINSNNKYVESREEKVFNNEDDKIISDNANKLREEEQKEELVKIREAEKEISKKNSISTSLEGIDEVKIDKIIIENRAEKKSIFIRFFEFIKSFFI